MHPKDVLHEKVLERLGDATGVYDYDQWLACWFLISKSEHDNEDPDKTFACAKGGSVFQYCDALSYDWKQRGVTCGIVGFTTANSGKAEWGDLQPVLEILKRDGGPNLVRYAKTCHQDKDDAKKLCRKIRSLKGSDLDAFIDAQFEALLDKGGYLYETVHAWKQAGVDAPSILAIATVFDASLNQGHDGKDGGCTNLVKIAESHHGDENKILKRFNAWRREVAGSKNYNSCAHNGESRSDMFETLRKRGQFQTRVEDAERVVTWTMK